MFMKPSDAEMTAEKNKKFWKPASRALFDITAIPMMDVDCEMVSAAVAGLNRPAIALMTMPKYEMPIEIASQGAQL